MADVDDRISTPLPPADPPTRDDFVRAILFQNNIIVAFTRSQITRQRLVDGYRYSTTMALRLAARDEGPPPWFGPALQAAIAEAITLLENRVKKLERRTAIAFNQSQIPGRLERFEVVYFPNLEDPTEGPHNLPALTSRRAIVDLTAAQKRSYCDGYYPARRVHRNDRDRYLYMAIGVRMPI